jgi:catechol 2,3-dioxygenase-like lactoylglutathione lyase family enzyme
MSIRGFNHVSVTTEDLDRSLHFYADLLGLTITGTGETAADHLSAIIGMSDVRVKWAELDMGDGQMLELFEYLQPRGTPLRQRTCDPGSVHIALEVNEIDCVHANLAKAGVSMRSSPVEIFTGDWIGTRSLYALDPDGVTVELVQPSAARRHGFE